MLIFDMTVDLKACKPNQEDGYQGKSGKKD